MLNAKKRTFISILSLIICLSLIPTMVYAEDLDIEPTTTPDTTQEVETNEQEPLLDEETEVTNQEEINDEESQQVEDSYELSDEELLNGYAESQLNNLFGGSGIALCRLSMSDSLLNPLEKKLYDYNKEQIQKIASGERTNTVVVASSQELFGVDKKRFTAQELGVNQLNGENVWSSFTNIMNLTKVVNCLKEDLPYDLYWFDLVSGYSLNFENGQYTNKYFQLDGISISYFVKVEYSSSKTLETYQTDPSIGNQVRTATNNIQSIIKEASNLDDFGKLDRYRSKICDLTSYNYNVINSNGYAVNGYSDVYGNPWEVIWVFDGDANTSVVCEGYAKSFKYLCDLSSFESENISCYTVYGNNHMWDNIVMPDGKTYLVDITNCDDGHAGAPDRLFLNGVQYQSGSYAARNLVFTASSVTYFYDTVVYDLFSEDQLTLSQTSYQTATPTPTPTPTPVENVNMYRLYNPNSGEHFYTANAGERDMLAKVGWRDEGIGWIAPSTGKQVYRMYNKNAGDHHYTTNPDERDMLLKVGWSYEGVGWYSAESEAVPLYREYNPNAEAGSHNYTTNLGEHNMLVKAGWKDEGIAWYGK